MMWHKKWLFIALASLALLRTPSALAQDAGNGEEAGQGNEINMAVGETHTLSAKGVKNYSEGVSGVIDVKLTTDASKFVLVGRKPGSTTLLFIKNDGSQVLYNVNVFLRPPDVVEKELEQLLSGLNVQWRRVGAKIVLDGAVESDAELKRVEEVVALYPQQVISLVQKASVGGAAPVRRAGKQYLIRIDFYFVQYDKNSSYGVGIGWPESIGGGTADISYDFLAGTTTSATASIAGQPLPRLDIASRHGWAKVLKQATVITDNNAEAKFSSGGEQNFPVNTGLTIGVEKINFGTKLTVLPRYNDKKSEINLKLEADVSDLTASVTGTNLPGRNTSKLTTNVSLKLGQSLILSGIRSESLTHGVTGVPGLSQIPVLGILFGSHSQSMLQTEGAIFVVPTVVQSVPESAAELVNLAMKKFEAYEGDIESVRAYDKRPGGQVGVPR